MPKMFASELNDFKLIVFEKFLKKVNILVLKISERCVFYYSLFVP